VIKSKLTLGILSIILFTSFCATATALHVSTNSNISSSTRVTQLWSFTPVGIVNSSPILTEECIYFVTSFEDYPQGIVYCLSASTGIQIWNYTEIQGHAFSIAVSEGYVYTTSTYGNVYAFNSSTGAPMWNFTTENPAGSPTVAGDHVYVISGGDVWSIDAYTGVQKWRYTTGSYLGSSLLVSDGRVYVGPDDNIVYCLDASTGTKLWSYAIENDLGNLVAHAPPVVAGGQVYMESAGRNVYVFDASTGVKKWNYTTEDPVTPPIYDEGVVYVGFGSTIPHFGDIRGVKSNVLALDALTGEKIWNYTIERPKGFIVVDRNVVYVVSAGGFGSNIDHPIYTTIYALQTHTSALPTLTLPLVTGIAVIVVAVVLIVYGIKRQK